jgi:hypothetical protein
MLDGYIIIAYDIMQIILSLLITIKIHDISYCIEHILINEMLYAHSRKINNIKIHDPATSYY